MPEQKKSTDANVDITSQVMTELSKLKLQVILMDADDRWNTVHAKYKWHSKWHQHKDGGAHRELITLLSVDIIIDTREERISNYRFEWEEEYENHHRDRAAVMEQQIIALILKFK